MSVLYVDLEHGRVVDDAAAGASHWAQVHADQARLAAAAGEPCDVVRFDTVTVDRIRSLNPAAMVISGSTADWSEYDHSTLAGLLETIQVAPVPILGICGGHQLIGRAHGAPWGPLGRLGDGTIDPDPGFGAGFQKEQGFLPIAVDRGSSLFGGMGEAPVVFHSHYWQLTAVPEGFTACARSAASPIQAIARRDRPVFGVQFHPEHYDDDHPDGETILHNFFATARANPPPGG